MLFDILRNSSKPFQDATAPGCMVLDIQAVADFYQHERIKWESLREEKVNKLPAQIQTWAEYKFTEAGEGGVDHWSIGHLIRMIPSEWALGTLDEFVENKEELKAYSRWVQVDTFTVLRGTRRQADTPSKVPMGRPIHSANVYLMGFSENGWNCRPFMIVQKPNGRGEMEAPFGFERMLSVYDEKYYPVGFPAIPFTAFALLAGEVCGLQ